MKLIVRMLALLALPTFAQAQACPSGAGYAEWLDAGWCRAGNVSLRLDPGFYSVEDDPLISILAGPNFLEIKITGGGSPTVPGYQNDSRFNFFIDSPQTVASLGIREASGGLFPMVGGSYDWDTAELWAIVGPGHLQRDEHPIFDGSGLPVAWLPFPKEAGPALIGPAAIPIDGDFTRFFVLHTIRTGMDQIEGPPLSTTQWLDYSVTRITFVPEPSTNVLLAAGFALLLSTCKRRRVRRTG